MGELQPVKEGKALAYTADLLGKMLQQIHALCFLPAVLRPVLDRRRHVVMRSCTVMPVLIGEASVIELRSLRNVPRTEQPLHARSLMWLLTFHTQSVLLGAISALHRPSIDTATALCSLSFDDEAA